MQLKPGLVRVLAVSLTLLWAAQTAYAQSPANAAGGGNRPDDNCKPTKAGADKSPPGKTPDKKKCAPATPQEAAEQAHAATVFVGGIPPVQSYPVPAPGSSANPPADRPLPQIRPDNPMAGALNQFYDPRAPAWLLSFHAGLGETLTDNVRNTPTGRQSDIITTPSVAVRLSGDTPRQSVFLDFNTTYYKYATATERDRFTWNGIASDQATLISGLAFIDINGAADQQNAGVGGLANSPLLNNSIQTYLLSVSPYLRSPIANIGDAELRYAGSWDWFGDQDRTFAAPTSLGRVSDTSQHQLYGELRIPGTVISSLLTDIVASGQYIDASRTFGIFRRYLAFAANELQLTRAFSLIGAAGYEQIQEKQFSGGGGEDPVWAAGFRWHPSPDSSVVLTYGRYDLKEDFAGEAQFRLTPLLALYAAYTDSIGTAQETFNSNLSSSILQARDVSVFSGEGAAAGVTANQNPILSTLNKSFVDEQTALDQTHTNFGGLNAEGYSTLTGLPLADLNNFLPAQDGIFRSKFARVGALRSIADETTILLEAFYIDRKSLVGTVASLETEGATLSSSTQITTDLSGNLGVTYQRLVQLHSDAFNASIGANYLLSHNFTAAFRFDHYRQESGISGGQSIQNSITLDLLATL